MLIIFISGCQQVEETSYEKPVVEVEEPEVEPIIVLDENIEEFYAATLELYQNLPTKEAVQYHATKLCEKLEPFRGDQNVSNEVQS